MSTIPLRPRARRLPSIALAVGLALLGWLLGWLLAGPSGAALGLVAALVPLWLTVAREPVTPRALSRIAPADRVIEPVWIRRSEVHRARAVPRR